MDPQADISLLFQQGLGLTSSLGKIDLLENVLPLLGLLLLLGAPQPFY